MAYKPSVRERRRDDLWDDLTANPAGLTVEDMMSLRSWTHNQANKAIHDLRVWLGEYDNINLPCDPQGQGDRWVYRLTGSLDDVEAWSANRVKDADTRLRTMQSMLASIVAATSGRTPDGRRARLMEKQLKRLVEDLDDLILDPTGATLTP
jgi:hypothetical protein